MSRIRVSKGCRRSGAPRVVRAALLPFCLLGAGVAGCTTDLDPVAVQTVQFDVGNDSALVGRTYQLRVTVKDANGVELTGRRVTFESLFPAIAESDANGLVTVKHPGGASFRATVEGRSAQAFLKAMDPVTKVSITPIGDQMPVGQTRQFIATATSASGAAIGGRFIAWRSLNTNVATITAQGVVSAISEGVAIIEGHVELDNVRGSTTITVIKVPVANISMAPVGTQIVRLGAFLQATATPRDQNNTPLTGRQITWSTSNPAVATVSQSGLISAAALGTATITAESEGRTASLGVQVTEVPPKSVTLDPDTVSLGTGATRQLVPTVIDSLDRLVTSLNTRSVVWASSNSAVASVSQAGVVTGVTAGVARVNVTVDNVRSDDVVFVVTDQVASIRLTPSLPQLMRVGNTLQVTATALNNQNTPIPGKTFAWTSSNNSIATVSSGGLVAGVAPGSATITAEVDGRTASLTVNVTLVPIGTVTLVPAQDTLISGDQKQYNPVVTDSAGRPVNSLIGRNVVWFSNNVPVASVNNQGIVQASVAQTGNALVNVTIDGVTSNNIAIRVSQVAAIQVTPSPVSVAVGATQPLTVTLKDAQNNTLTTSRTILFSVPGANPPIVTVSPAGVVTGVTVGSTTITVTVQGLVGIATQVPVTVTP
jgi:uncharacterized protein YjdB